MVIGRHALDLNSSQPQIASPEWNHTPPPRQTTPTPSEWPPSSPSHRDVVLKMEVDSDSEDESRPMGVPMSQEAAIPSDRPSSSSRPSSHISAPTPAQRPKPLSPSASSSPAKVASSSAPLPSATTPSQPQSSPTSSLPVHMRRRVPYPTPPAPIEPDTSGFGRILVPNSDTSGQSQSQSQARCEQLHASQSNFLAVLQDLPRAQTNGHLPARNKTDEPMGPPAHQPPLRPSQPDSYDGDRSSPEMRFQSDLVKQMQRSDANGHVEFEVVEHREQEVDEEEEVDQLQSDDEQQDDGNVVEKQTRKRELSDDDAQIHAMLTKDSPQIPVPHADRAKASARTTPPPESSPQVNVEQDAGSSATRSPSQLAYAASGSRKQARAASPSPILLPLNPAPPIKAKDGDASSSRTNSKSVEVEHDVQAWTNPSFMQSANKGKVEAEPVVHAAPAQGDRATSRSRALLLTSSSSKTSVSTDNSPQKLYAGAITSLFKNNSATGQTGRVNPLTAAGPSRPNKRDRDRLSESSSRGDLASESRKKRKVEAGESDNRVPFTSGRSDAWDHDFQMGNVNREEVKPSLISNDTTTDAGSGHRNKSPGGSNETVITSTSTSSGRRSKAQDPDIRMSRVFGTEEVMQDSYSNYYLLT
jgi:hypothetical protein